MNVTRRPRRFLLSLQAQSLRLEWRFTSYCADPPETGVEPSRRFVPKRRHRNLLMTTQAQRHKASEIASEITKLQGIRSAVVDDDDGYGSFTIINDLVSRLEGPSASRRIEFEISLHGLMARITRI